MIRLLVTLVLFLAPVTSAHAAFLEDLMIKPASSSSSSTASSMPVQREQASSARSSGVQILDPLPEYEDDQILTRAEFTAKLVRSRFTDVQIENCLWNIAPKPPPSFWLVFTDVSIDHRYVKEICTAMRTGIAYGEGDGSFDPERPITFAEAGKMLSRAYALAPYAQTDTVSPWYFTHVRALAQLNVIPVSITGLEQRLTTADADEMMDRLENGITSRPAQTEAVLMPPPAPARTSSNSSSSVSSTPTPKKSSTNSSASSSAPASSSASSEKGSFWDLF